VIRGNDLNRAAGLEGRALSVQADFMKLAPFADNSFDGVYAIEATCHAPVREGVYSQIYRVLKPGQIFACYEWCLTPKYDPNNELHRTIKKKIEEGDGLPDMASQQECVDALTSVGFEVCFFSLTQCELYVCCALVHLALVLLHSLLSSSLPGCTLLWWWRNVCFPGYEY
jgi:SAM-dependent methyltransferase